MKFISVLTFLFISSLLIFAGCQSAPTPTTPELTTSNPIVTPANSPSSPVASPTKPASTEITVTDDIGRQVTFKAAPRRIISLAPSNTEMVYALGLEDKLIGVTTYCNYPEAAKSKPRVSEYSNVDYEKIVSLEPDLVLADHIHIRQVVPALEKLGLPVLVLSPTTIDQIIGDLKLVGNLTGQSQNTEALINNLTERIQKITDKVKSLNTNPVRVLYVSWHDPIWTAGDNSIIGDLFSNLGVANIASDLDGWATLTLEKVVERNPQVILVLGTMGDQNTSFDYINSESRLQATEALKNKQVYLLDTDIFGRTTPRIVDGMETLAKILYPDTFK